MNRDDFMRQLRATFRVEADEHLQTIGGGLSRLGQVTEPTEQQPIIEAVFRAAHSLKGASRAVDFSEIEGVCQSLEGLFAAWKRGNSVPTPESLEAAQASLDRIQSALAKDVALASASASAATAAGPAVPQSATPPVPRSATPAARAAAPQAPRAATPQAAPAPPPPAIAPAQDSDTVRVTVRALDQRLLEAEELLSAKLTAAQRTRELDGLLPQFEVWRQEWQRVQAEAHGNSAALEDFIGWSQEWLRGLEMRVAGLRRAAEQDQVSVGKMVDDLLENSKQLLMLPLGTVTPLLRKVVRDLSRELGKDTELNIRGEEILMDKRILEEMKDPLVHLLRNALDHGIETSSVRANAGKPARATIDIHVSQIDGNQVEIAVGDDGAGIDVERVRSQAVTRGMFSAAAARELSAEAVQALVFETDLSTSPMITELSGRGLGLAIVREKAEKLGGRVGIQSERGAGTTVRMTLPLTLATFRGVLVESARRTFVVPTAQVERVTRFRRDDVQTVEGRDTLAHQGRALALCELADALRLAGPRNVVNGEARSAVVLGSGGERIAFAVDAVLDEREVLVKRLGAPLVHVRNIAGATVLASGTVAPILNVAELMKSARNAPRASAPDTAVEASGKPKRALVAEDSITSRMLLKGILESAGYEVKTAVDGLDAFTMLRTETFDVLVSDVEMPRLNGFDLTARLRADRTLAELPVVLVTALGTREDRERGIEVGANAYLVKGDLDQGNLLDTVRRLA